ncbi:MAG: cytochrome C [Nitrospirae bacterium]|nr:MAG: cytochrome C [Nitrospirota bacterium]
MAIGRISSLLNRRVVLILTLQFVLLVVLLGYRHWQDSSAECIRCHSNKKLLKELNAEWAYVTLKEVQKESKHPNILCRDCHLGNGRAKDKDTAHRGMLKMLIVGMNGELLPRKQGYPGPLRETGDDRMFALMPKELYEGDLYMLEEVRNILWHDHDPKTLGFDPKIAERTCGRPDCHPDELKQFRTTIMGRNYRQRTMRTWLKPYGPHNCGPSFADLQPPAVLDRADFDYKNTEEIMENLNVPFSKGQAEDKQKFCNVCHAGCLDCHFTPSNKQGRHAFSRTPPPESCLGYGRSASQCHPGAMVSRRGETYIGGDYSIPQGMSPDVHYKLGITCVDCHPPGEKGMGDMERAATCQDCHIETEEAHAGSIHRNMDCATCHVRSLGGYQLTVWGPGRVAERPNPFHKYSLYYGIQEPPIIIKDQKGRWMPVKLWPHSVGNIKRDVPSSGSIKFRWPNGETRDAYYIVGTFDGLPENNKHLLWIEIEQAAHPFQRARDCDSCHASETQISYSTWEFNDYDGADSFRGNHKIVADSRGLRFVDIKNTTPIRLLPGARLTDFATWLYLKDKWEMPGDFSIKTDRNRYRIYKERFENLMKRIKRIDELSKDFSKKKKRLWKELRSAAIHDPDRAEEILSKFQ